MDLLFREDCYFDVATCAWFQAYWVSEFGEECWRTTMLEF